MAVRGKGVKVRIQERILKRRAQAQPIKEEVVPSSPGMTLVMRLIELRFDTPLAVLLQQGTLEEVAKQLGIDQSTVSKWRLRLNLRSARDQ